MSLYRGQYGETVTEQLNPSLRLLISPFTMVHGVLTYIASYIKTDCVCDCDL